MVTSLRTLASYILAIFLLWQIPSALASDATQYQARAALAVLNMEFARAIDIYTEGLARNHDLKERAELLLMRGRAFEYAKKPEQAEADYFEVVRLIGDSDPRAYSDRGLFYYNQSRWDDSIADYARGAQLFPNNGVFPYGIGRSLTKQEKFADALVKLNDAIRLDPTSGVFRLARAETHFSFGQPERAIEDYNTALVLGKFTRKELAWLRAGRGYALTSLKKYNAAIESEFDQSGEVARFCFRETRRKKASHSRL
jgi:tetratricopeptide (TPR) repeat protein